MQHFVEKISGYERINSDKNRLDGQREHLKIQGINQ